MKNGWIVCWVIEETHNTKPSIYTDHYEVFVDDDCEQNSLKRFNELCEENSYCYKTIYSVNRCKIVNSTEAIYLNIPI